MVHVPAWRDADWTKLNHDGCTQYSTGGQHGYQGGRRIRFKCMDEELEPVVTPKTWIVVFVHLSFFPFLSCCRSVLEYWFWPQPRFSLWDTVSLSGPFQLWLRSRAKSPQVLVLLPSTSGSSRPGHSLSRSALCFGSSTIHICLELALISPSGANTDLLGRRWFLVGGNLICTVGHLVVATSKSANAVIAGMGKTAVLLGLRVDWLFQRLRVSVVATAKWQLLRYRNCSPTNGDILGSCLRTLRPSFPSLSPLSQQGLDGRLALGAGTSMLLQSRNSSPSLDCSSSTTRQHIPTTSHSGRSSGNLIISVRHFKLLTERLGLWLTSHDQGGYCLRRALFPYSWVLSGPPYFHPTTPTS